MNRVFLLSPANCNGLRARWVLRRNSRSELARRLRTGGVPLGELFTFLSALYFRGKLAYAKSFAQPPHACPGILIITPSAGLMPHDTSIRLPKLRGFARVPIHLKNRLYRTALRSTAKKLAVEIGSDCEVVLLGSVATEKYLAILAPIFGSRLRVPVEFIGRGDMSRGGLLLRCVRENRQLNYSDPAVVLATGRKRSRTDKQMTISSAEPATIAEDFLT